MTNQSMLADRDGSHREVAKMVENVLGSKARVRILVLLSLHPDKAFSKYRIAQEARLDRGRVSEHLGLLEEEGLVRRVGGLTSYELNLTDERAKVTMNYFQILRQLRDG